jgi:CRISPR-associated protein Cas2
MLVLITYDVATVDKAGARRLRRVAQACKDYGQRVQNSVFECRIEPQHWIVLRDRLLQEVNQSQDSLRFYFLDRDVKIEHHGIKKPVDLEGPLVL